MTLSEIRERVENPSPYRYLGVEEAVADRAELLKRLDALTEGARAVIESADDIWETDKLMECDRGALDALAAVLVGVCA